MRIIKIIIITVLLSIAVQAQQLVEGIVAVIGNEIVLKSEVDNLVQSYAIQNRINITGDKEKLEALRKEVLDKLVEQKILLAKAEEDTVTIDEREIDQRVEQNIRYMIQQVGSEEKLEEAFQSPMKKIRRDLRKETEERLKIDMLRRSKFQMVKVSRREVENFYNTYKDSLPPIKETVEIAHILKQIKAGESSRQAALDKIREIKKQLDAGADFEELARKYSEDVASAKRGGDLGFTKRGDFVKEFEETAFSLKQGEISDIVETQFGFHIIQLIERRGEKVRTRHILIQSRPTEDDERRIIAELKEIRDKILAGAPFDSMAVIHSDDQNAYKDKGYLGTWEVEKLAIPAFARIVRNLKPGEISEPFKTEYGYHIVKLISKQTARTLNLAQDWDKIQEMALNRKIEKEYKKWIARIKKEIPVEVRMNFN